MVLSYLYYFMGAELSGAVLRVVLDGAVNVQKNEVESALTLLIAKRYAEALEKFEILISKNPK